MKIFRKLMRLRNILESFSEFEDDDPPLPAQRFAEYRSTYLDLYDKVKTDNQTEKASILENIDFERGLIHRDDKALIDPDIVNIIDHPVGILERSPTRKRLTQKIVDFVETFIRGIAA
ncbi:type I restriction endonuclease subunit R, EcoR124 family [Roseibacillus persicicus]|uniref:type I restriction endonuclease subunit R, EcoR124 family n=1 Tax=Roseibacillus persicicus TaxID=454148 RepID=UPI00227D9678|nr:hypothetical protein [Roseibacillus persicicus]